MKQYRPDVPITELGVLQEHFRGGTGEPWDWPQILPMWWGYKNPVSGRLPELFLAGLRAVRLRARDEHGEARLPAAVDGPGAKRRLSGLTGRL